MTSSRATVPFPRSLDLKLIQLVKEQPILHNQKHKFYFEQHLKIEAWEKIGKRLNRDGKRCKRRWINIRDNMKRKIRDRAQITDPDAPIYKYKYEDELDFIFNDQECSEGEDNYITTEDFPVKIEADQIEDLFEATETSILTKHDISCLVNNEVPKDNPVASSTQSEEMPESISIFLEAVGSTLKNLTPYYLNQAKSKIFQVVQECELKQIINKGEHPKEYNDTLD